MELTSENYYSNEADTEYMSVSQYKSFVGTYGRLGCEATAMRKLLGTWEDEPSTALLIGSYVDAYFEGTLDNFKIEHPELFKRDGSLKADFVKADTMIERVNRSEKFLEYMSGEKQVIMTGEIAGAKWKIKMDSYIPGACIVDLKTVESITKPYFVRDYGHMDFCQYWGYDIQGAVYQEIVRQNTGQTLPFLIAAVSKEKEPDIELIRISDKDLKVALETVERNVDRIVKLKNGEEYPDTCDRCDCCRHFKELTTPIFNTEIQLAI